MSDKKLAIKLSTLEGIGNAIREKEGSTDAIPVNALADRIGALQIASGENKFAQVVEKTLTELTENNFIGITKIENGVFESNANLKTVTMPEGVTSIGPYAFGNCPELSTITIPVSAKTIGDKAFMGTNASKKIYYNGSVSDWCDIDMGASYDTMAFYNIKAMYFKNASGNYEIIENAVVNGITEIKRYVFQRYHRFKTLTIGDDVQSIGLGAFEYNDFTDVRIGNGVTLIKNNAFGGCSNLKTVRIGSGITEIWIIAFSSTAITDIYIDKPEDSVSGAPWGATNATIHWNTPLPSEEV